MNIGNTRIEQVAIASTDAITMRDESWHERVAYARVCYHHLAEQRG